MTIPQQNQHAKERERGSVREGERERESQGTRDRFATFLIVGIAHITACSKLDTYKIQETLPDKHKNDGADDINEVTKPEVQRKVVESYVPPISFPEALEQIPKYAKFMKDFLTNKAKFKETSKVTLNERCSAILLNEIPLKEKDPGSFTIPCARYFQIPLAPEDQEKTTFTCPYGTFAYKRMPFGLYNAPATFQRCMTAIFNDMFNDFIEEKCHFMVKKGLVIGHKISSASIEIDKAKEPEKDPWYADYANFLVSKVMPRDLTYHLRKKFLSDLNHYIWDEPYLFKSCPDIIIRRCVFGKELQEILEHFHKGPTGGHYGADITARKIFESGFYWPTIFKNAVRHVQECDACQRARNISSRNQIPLTNSIVSEVFDIWSIDFMEPFPSSRNNKYILVVVDYVFKWVEAEAFLTNDARAFRTAYKSPIGSTPFRIVYGKAFHLLIEMDHKVYWALENVNLDLDAAGRNRFLQLNKLVEMRNEAYEHSCAYKERKKWWYDARIMDKEFQEREEVLFFNSRLKLFPGSYSKEMEVHNRLGS
ncbi:reverse transcriptase domain-containing protein [Tanacetum coccineum]